MRWVSVVNDGSIRSIDPTPASSRNTSSPSWNTSTSFEAVATAASSSSICRLSRPASSSCPFVTQTSRARRSGSVTGKPWCSAAKVTGTPTATASATAEATGLRARTQAVKVPTLNPRMIPSDECVGRPSGAAPGRPSP